MANVSIVTDVGLGNITTLLAASVYKWVAWGIGTTEASASGAGADLVSEGAEARTDGTQSQQTVTTTDDTYRVVGAITCTGAGKAITEVTIMNDETAGTCFMRANFDAINVAVGDSVQFTINNTLDQSA